MAIFFTNDEAGAVSSDEENDEVEEGSEHGSEMSAEDEPAVTSLTELQPVPYDSSIDAFSLIESHSVEGSFSDPLSIIRTVARTTAMNLAESNVVNDPDAARYISFPRSPYGRKLFGKN